MYIDSLIPTEMDVTHGGINVIGCIENYRVDSIQHREIMIMVGWCIIGKQLNRSIFKRWIELERWYMI